MNCDEALLAISERLDGELSAEDSLALEEHLKACPACRALERELAQLNLDVAELTAEAPETLASGVMRAIRAEREKKPAPKKRVAGIWVFAAAAAAVLLLGAAGVIQLPGFGQNHASASVGHAFAKPAEVQTACAERVAEERGCPVLLIRSCPDGIEALNGMDFETESDGARLYTVPAEVMDGILDAWQAEYPMEIHAPKNAAAETDGTACILIFS